MKRVFIALYFLAGLAASAAFGADARYTLTEYSMNGCAACVAALEDVAAITSSGIDVRCVNTSVDAGAAEEARRYNLQLRPAWRLARSNGTEVGRWYGAGKSALIVATIRAKFPTPDVETPVEIPAEEPEEEIPIDATVELPPKPELAPSALAELDALADEAAPEESEIDFRDRAPVVEKFQDASFLDKSLDEWERRDELDDDESDQFEEEEEEENHNRFFAPRVPEPSPEQEDGERARLGDRIADRAASRLLKGLIPELESFKADALQRLDRIGSNVGGEVKSAAVVELRVAKQELLKSASDEIGAFKRDLFKEVDALVWRVVKAGCALMICVCAFVYFLFATLIKKLERQWKS